VRAGYGIFTVALAPGGRVLVRLPPEQWQPPVRAAYVWAQPKTAPSRAAVLRLPASIDENGTYLLQGVSPGEYDLIIRPIGPASPANGVVVRGVTVVARQTVEVTALPAPPPPLREVLTGRVLERRGKVPLTGQTVYARGKLPGGESWSTSATTDAEGRFTLHVHAGECLVSTSSYDTELSRDVTASAVVTAGVAASIGDIETTGKPLARGRLVNASGEPVAGRVVGGLDDAQTKADGSFSLWPQEVERGRAVFLHALSNDRTLGWSFLLDSALLDPRLAAAGATLPKITLQPVAQIIGRAVSESGQPLPDASVWLSCSVGDGLPNTIDRKAVPLIQEQERFRFPFVPTGLNYKLRISTAGSEVWVDLGALRPGEVRDLGEVKLQLLRPRPLDPDADPLPPKRNRDFTGRLVGRAVDDAGAALAGVNVSAAADSGDMRNQPSDTTDFEGRFIIDGLPKGEHVRLFARDPQMEEAQAVIDVGDTSAEIQMQPLAAAMIGKPAPELAIQRWINSPPLKMQDLRGKVVVLQFGFDSVMTQNITQFTGVFDIVTRYNPKDVLVIGIHCDPQNSRPTRTTANDVAAYITAQKVPCPFGIDSILRTRPAGGGWYGGETAVRYLIPAAGTVLIDKKGVIRAVTTDSKAAAIVEKLLAE
jgi:hypothetical protein